MNNNLKIFDILNIKPMQHFKIEGVNGEYWITENGLICYSDYPISSQHLVEIINGSRKILIIHEWTDTEINYAKCIIETIGNWKLKWTLGNISICSDVGNTVFLRENSFPSLIKNEVIRLSDIVGEN